MHPPFSHTRKKQSTHKIKNNGFNNQRSKLRNNLLRGPALDHRLLSHLVRPVQKIAPIIDELAEEYAGKATICKCDVDESEELTSRFGVRNVPTVLFIKTAKSSTST